MLARGLGLASAASRHRPLRCSARGAARWMSVAAVPNRAMLRVSGVDAEHFLQGLVTNDVKTGLDVDSPSPVFAAFLSNKGRILAEVIIHRNAVAAAADADADADAGAGDGGSTFLLDVHVDVVARLKRLLAMMKLRSKVTLADVSDAYQVVAVLPDSAADLEASGPDAASAPGLPVPADLQLRLNEDREKDADFLNISFHVQADPRCPELGLRLLARNDGGEAGALASAAERVARATSLDGSGEVAAAEAYTARRLACGVAEGMEVDGGIALEFNLDKLNGVSFDKGCYTGQELTARTHFQGLVRKRVLPLQFEAGAEAGAGAPGGALALALALALAEGPAPKVRAAASPEGKAVGRLVAFDEGSGRGLALMRIAGADGFEEAWAAQGALVVDGRSARMPGVPTWWG